MWLGEAALGLGRASAAGGPELCDSYIGRCFRHLCPDARSEEQ